MTILVTGASGFIGRAVAQHLRGATAGVAVRLLDRAPPSSMGDPRFTAITCDLGSRDAIAAAIEGVSTIIHLASLPGGDSERDPAASRRINIDATLGLLEAIDAGSRPVRFIYASSIAVFGVLPTQVDDRTPLNPGLVYGAHKQMVEIALSDFHRRGRVDGIALRLPGIVARPGGSTGLKSAFLSDIFHAAREGRPYAVPVSRDATAWMMSVSCVARNLVHAAGLSVVDGQALTLPAIRVAMGDLADRLFRPGSGRPTFEPDSALQALFGSYPPLLTPAARALGFEDDGDIDGLIGAVDRQLEMMPA